MPLETATYISQLVSTNPVHTDGLNAADSHLRLLKAVLQAQFPNFTAAALASTQAQIDATVSAYNSGVLTFAVGTAAAPSFKYTGDLTTGLYHPAAGQVGVTLSGVLQTLFSAAGITLNSGDVNVVAGAFKLNGTNIFPLQAANIGAGQVGTAALAASGVTYAKIQNVTNARLLGNNSGGAAAPSEISLGTGLSFAASVLNATAKAPTVQAFTTGSAATYTTPANATLLRVRMLAGGGGGGAVNTNAGSAGGNSSFGTWTAVGGNGGASGSSSSAASGGTGGTNGTGTQVLRITGGTGGGGSSLPGDGGSSIFGGAPKGHSGSAYAGIAAAANSGSGGGGGFNGAGSYGNGGAAGEYVEFIISSPAATYTYTVGALGAGGTAGSQAGGNGGSGVIIVEEYYG